MQAHLPRFNFFRPSLSAVLLIILLGTLWLAGGASRADAFGQVVVRGVAWMLAVMAILLGERPTLRNARPVLFLLLAALALPLLQLIPLPPAIWHALPGRAMFAEAASASGQAQPWRPWSIVPGATINAASSLVVPFVTLLLITSLKPAERAWLPDILLGLIVVIALTGLLQLTGSAFNNPFVNETAGEVSGTFANRNHFALLLATGCLVAPVWAFLDDRRPQWRGAIALGLVLFFTLTILATGSRAGLGLGLLGISMGILFIRQGISRSLRRQRRWVLPASITAAVSVIAGFVLIGVAADRAVSITRMLALDTSLDMRNRGLPTVLDMIRTYFPVGAGLGSFDPIFRIHEPFALLKPTYFNHAHNDWLEILLDAGIPGSLVVIAGLAWWAAASVRAWRAGSAMRHALPKLGSAILLFVFIGSAVDYPARTPLIMTVVVIAAIWLCDAFEGPPAYALPERHLAL